MNLLNGAISKTFAKAFAGIYLPATLHRRTLIDDGEGGYTTTTTDYPCRAQIDAVTEAMRQEPGYDFTDRRILILADTLEVVPDTDCEISVRAERFGIQSVNSDPALSYFEVRGSRA